MDNSIGLKRVNMLFVSVYFQEDYIAELQEKLKQLRSRISNERELQALANEKEDYNLIRRLQGELGVSTYIYLMRESFRPWPVRKKTIILSEGCRENLV